MKAPKIFSTKRQAIESAKQTVLIAVVIASIIVSVGLVTTNFLYDLGRYNARVISEKEAALDTIEANIDSVDDLVTSFQAFEAGPDLLSNQGDKQNSSVVLDALPSKYDFPALATAMESLVRENGLRLESFGGQDNTTAAIQSAAQPTPQEIPFTLVVVGSYEDVQGFMVKLQNTIQPMTVDQIKLSGSDNDIRAELSLRTFYQPSVSLDVETKDIQ